MDGNYRNDRIPARQTMTYIGVNAEWLKEHDKQVMKKEREQTLKDLQTYYDNLPEHEASCPYGEMNESEDCQKFNLCDECILNRAIVALREGDHK